jgi:uncharacterized protein
MTVFVDTAIIMYAAGGDHPLREPSRRVLRAIASGVVAGLTSAEVIQEILHRFLGRGETDTGAAMARNALELFAPVIPITHSVMARMPDLAREHPGLAARDLVHVATCREVGITVLVSPDRGFDDVAGLQRVDPGDEVGVDALVTRGR